MIRKLRRKIFIVLMAVMCIFLVVFLSSIMAGINGSNAHRSRRSMQPPGPQQHKAKEDEEEEFFAPIACAVVEEDGTVTVIKNQIYYLDEDTITEAVQALQSSEDNHGTVTDYQLRYNRNVFDGKTTYFFSDTTVERQMLRTQIRIMLIAAGVAVLLFFLISFFLSKWMVRPAERAWNRQRQFVADASHELKTPLTVILSNTDLLMASGAITDEKNLNRIENINTESRRMKQLVEELLTLARTDAAPAGQKRERIDLTYLVNSVILTLEPSIYDQGHMIETDIQDGIYVNGIPADLQKLIEILLDNAGKYGTKGTDIAVALQGQRKEAVLSVTSQGKALSREECTAIFERFYRTDASRTQNPGYGLGLSIAQNIVKEHQGQIEAASDGESRNTFLVRLPMIS